MKNTNTQKEELLKRFPMPDEVATEIDKKIKSYLQIYSQSSMRKVKTLLINVLESEEIPVTEKINDKSDKIEELAYIYIENENMTAIQENWACFIGFFISNIFMVLSILNMSPLLSFLLSVALCLFAVGLWYAKIASPYSKTKKNSDQKKDEEKIKRQEIYFCTFNHFSGLITFLELILFNFLYVALPAARKFLGFIPLITVIFCLYIVGKWYKRNLESDKIIMKEHKAINHDDTRIK